METAQRTADRAARAAGTVYRVVAGTESLGINDSADITQKSTNHDETARTITDGHSDGVNYSDPPSVLTPILLTLLI